LKILSLSAESNELESDKTGVQVGLGESNAQLDKFKSSQSSSAETLTETFTVKIDENDHEKPNRPIDDENNHDKSIGSANMDNNPNNTNPKCKC
jgi:hypothetical protein